MSDTNIVSLVESGRGDLNDIPARMEGMAAAVRAGEHGAITSGACVLLTENGELVVCGWGRTDPVHSAGLLTMGAGWLTNNAVRRS